MNGHLSICSKGVGPTKDCHICKSWTVKHIDPIGRSGKHHWYFWDETWAHRIGPFKRERQARRALVEYHRVDLEGLLPRTKSRKRYEFYRRILLDQLHRARHLHSL